MADAQDAKKTPLYATHKSLKAKMVPFGGWLMPVSYEGVLAEHHNVREKCGLFDVSHMGEVFVEGPDAAAFLQSVTINDVEKLPTGKAHYTGMCNEQGGMLDDFLIYHLDENRYLVCVNAANIEKDFQWLRDHSAGFPEARLRNESDEWALLAVQGPTSRTAVEAVLEPKDRERLGELSFMSLMATELFGSEAIVARTGYTGEHGYELFVRPDAAEKIWAALLETQPQTGITPTGLGARDTLRLEACLLLYGNDMDETVTPLEAGIKWATKFDSGDFVGKKALEAQAAEGLTRRNMALKMEENGIPRTGMRVFKDDQEVGIVTSGSVLPTVGGSGGMALLDPRRVSRDDSVTVDVRGKRKLARVVKKPLYTAQG